MSASQSNLSDLHYGFDLVVAVTQASVNATLKQFLAGISAPEVTVCYVYDNNNDLVPVDYRTLVGDAKGSDPFKVPAGSNPATDPDLINLSAANFAGAVRARIGLPNLPVDSLPAIATLGSGSNAPVLFNLLCSEFQITGFQYGPRGSATWINQSQPSGSGSPWYFSANVSLNSTTIDPNSPVPPAVQQRIAELQHDPANAFAIQKLFLDLDTAILQSSPTIQGVPSGWPVWNLITTVFLGSYFTQLRQNGNPVLSYSFTMAAPRPATLQLGSVSRECLPLLANGQPITNPTPAQLAATALVYVGTTSTTPPIPVPFAWNWVELGEVSSFSGVQSVRRDVFFTYFAGLVNSQVAPLCIDTNLSLTHSGEDFTVQYSSARSQNPASFRPVARVAPAESDGFTTMLTLNYACNSHDDSTSSTHLVEIWGDYNYTLNGTVAVSSNQMRVQVQVQVYMKFAHREVFVNYTDLDGANYYDKTLTVTYSLGVDQNGALQVTETHGVSDSSVPWNFDPKGILGKFGFEDAVRNGVTSVENNLASVIDSTFTNYVQQLTAVINGYRAWVFPGNDAFTFKNVAFSSGQDLIAQLTYVNPN
ncbi:hypothetical protein [Roseateles depolymerans]|uniref:Uncharacterized protein n=1 Tax=Roseateles depolymerans TaxID=76731 RepID=A0A0U2TWB2_9BURK|nr:hypothetical protein [Roseateles depolymerans]ALV04513.1 hypothetical protein RD2015_6 [Roseateles depolymerans]REG14044.1 hypothetical protein DES44_4056 [Roseateles depolymerans]